MVKKEKWKYELGKEQYEVLANKATERPFSGKYNLHFESGDYACAACGYVLFSSKEKFDAGCGWPSFSDVIEEGRVVEVKDRSLGMIRTEVLCGNCEGHLGHVFDDGPGEKGLRYCINSASLRFENE